PPPPRVRRGLIVKILAIVCLGVSVPIGAKWGYEEIFFENEEFILKRLNIRTDGALGEAGLAEIANVSAGMNLMELDLERIRQRIKKLPQVDEVSVSREMPDKLNVIVRERIPVAWVSCPPQGIRPGDMERGFLLDEKGYLFRCLDLDDGMMALPVIEAFKLVEPVEGARLETEGMDSALALIVENDRIFGEGAMEIHQVKLRNEWSIECVYRTGLQVTFGIFEIERGLKDLVTILNKTGSDSPALASVNVAARRNIPVTFAPEAEGSAVSTVAEPVETGEDSDADSRDNQQEKHLRSILKGG
ncbi:MAG: FtsQ-type POTRA domain-containing protein, partial [Verrucomicrobiales bacterium]